MRDGDGIVIASLLVFLALCQALAFWKVERSVDQLQARVDALEVRR